MTVVSFVFRGVLFFLLSFFFTSEALQVSGLSHIESLAPGARAEVRVSVHNDESQPETIEFHLADYSCNDQGEHFFDQPDEHRYPRSNTTWIQLGLREIVLNPGETREISYAIHVPADKSLVGSYWSVLLIEPKDPVPKKDANQQGLQLLVKVRYAHHIVVNVGEGEAKLKILEQEKRTIEGKNYLALHVVNEGNLFFNPAVTLKIYDSKGKLAHTLKGTSERLYPGNPQVFLLPFQELPDKDTNAKLKGFIVFDDGEDHLFGDQFSYP